MNSDKNYRAWEYKDISVPDSKASFYLDCYECFGWQQDENHPVAPGVRPAVLYLKRDRKIINKMELTRLQRNFEACLREIDLLERSKTSAATLWALLVGLAGTAFMAGSVFAVTAAPPHYLLTILLAVPGFAGWILPVFLRRRLTRARTRRVQPFIEAKYEEIYALCEKGHALL